MLGANEVIVKIRYRKQANRCRVTLTVEGLLRVRLIEPLESPLESLRKIYRKEKIGDCISDEKLHTILSELNNTFHDASILPERTIAIESAGFK